MESKKKSASRVGNFLSLKSNNLKFSGINTATVFICLAVLCVGLFNEYLSALFSLVLSIVLVLRIAKNRVFKFKVNLASGFAALMVSAYFVVTFWAVDSGVAIFGFVKFMPVLLYLLLCYQENVKADGVLKPLPYIAAAITVITAGLMQLKSLESLFSVAGRLSGTFQYANTYAIFCLIALQCECNYNYLSQEKSQQIVLFKKGDISRFREISPFK